MRMNDGREVWYRLLNWDKGQAAAERLSALILSNDGYKGVDPSHPLGGPDGLKDMALSYEGKKWIGAVYFPRGQQSFSDILAKYKHDLQGVAANEAAGIAFVTNQELRLGERKQLADINPEVDVRIYHLERIAQMLNSPAFYGIRLEFLDIEMTSEEQLAFFAVRDDRLSRMEKMIQQLSVSLDSFKQIHTTKAMQDDDYDDEMRSEEEIIDASEEFFDKIWFDRHMMLKSSIEDGDTEVDPDIWKGAMEAEKRMIEKYGDENLGPYSDFEWGMLNGKLSALRWVLGCEWDMLDT